MNMLFAQQSTLKPLEQLDFCKCWSYSQTSEIPLPSLGNLWTPFFYPLFHTFIFKNLPLQIYFSRCSQIKKGIPFVTLQLMAVVCSHSRDWESAFAVPLGVLPPSLAVHVNKSTTPTYAVWVWKSQSELRTLCSFLFPNNLCFFKLCWRSSHGSLLYSRIYFREERVCWLNNVSCVNRHHLLLFGKVLRRTKVLKGCHTMGSNKKIWRWEVWPSAMF